MDGNPLRGLIEAFDREAARVRDRSAAQSHAAHPGCPGGLMRDCLTDAKRRGTRHGA